MIMMNFMLLSDSKHLESETMSVLIQFSRTSLLGQICKVSVVDENTFVAVIESYYLIIFRSESKRCFFVFIELRTLCYLSCVKVEERKTKLIRIGYILNVTKN